MVAGRRRICCRSSVQVLCARRPQSVSELGNCIFQLLATLIFISIIQPYFLAGTLCIVCTSSSVVSQMCGNPVRVDAMKCFWSIKRLIIVMMMQALCR